MNNHRKDETFAFVRSGADIERENMILRETITQLKNEVERFREPALMVAELADIIDKNAVIKVPNGNKFFVNISASAKNLGLGDLVLVEQKNLTIIDKLSSERKLDAERFVIVEKPTITWKDIGGLSDQMREIKEVIELPLKEPELFRKVGIKPPKGVLLYGPPGTGKTLLAKAVAQSTDSTFIEIVASELVQKFIGEGAKLVKDIFNLAREKAPAIIFIDEIDALAAKRIDLGTSGEREVQRTFMQFLAEIDGFKNLDNVKIIGCTNRKDILDPAVIRPGRLDRLIEVPHPDKDGLKQIFKIHTKDMTLGKLDMPKLLKLMNDFSGAEVRATATEAGYFALRRLEETKQKRKLADLMTAQEELKREKVDLEKELKVIKLKRNDLSKLPFFKKAWSVIQGSETKLNDDEKEIKNKIIELMTKEDNTNKLISIIEKKSYSIQTEIQQSFCVTMSDLEDAIKKVRRIEQEHPDDFMHMFG